MKTADKTANAANAENAANAVNAANSANAVPAANAGNTGNTGNTDDVIAILTNAPDQTLARQMGAALVNLKLAACVNILGACESVYRWQGAVQTAREFPLIVKTTRARYAEIEAVIIRMHPYGVPEIIVLDIRHGLPAYLDWVRSETAVSLVA